VLVSTVEIEVDEQDVVVNVSDELVEVLLVVEVELEVVLVEEELELELELVEVVDEAVEDDCEVGTESSSPSPDGKSTKYALVPGGAVTTQKAPPPAPSVD